jgi:hypothetical protein
MKESDQFSNSFINYYRNAITVGLEQPLPSLVLALGGDIIGDDQWLARNCATNFGDGGFQKS